MAHDEVGVPVHQHALELGRGRSRELRRSPWIRALTKIRLAQGVLLLKLRGRQKTYPLQ